MNYKQLKTPNLNQTDYPGWCLRFVQSAYGGPHKYDYAWEQWEGSKQHTDALPDVMVPVYFSWNGTIDGVDQNWGDVAIWVPGHGVFGTPLLGGGLSNRWDKDVASRAAAIGGGAKYVGWSEDLAGQAVVKPVAVPAPKPAPKPTPVKERWVRIMGDYRTLYKTPGANPFQKLAPNAYGGHLDYQVLSTDGEYVQIHTQMFGMGWIFVGPAVASLTQYFDK